MRRRAESAVLNGSLFRVKRAARQFLREQRWAAHAARLGALLGKEYELFMTSPARLLLARHGRTALNAEGRLRGLADPPLDEVGVREAEGLADALAPARFFVVLSSPLVRAVTTAQHIALAAGVPHRIDERLNDRDYGPWTGHLKADVVEEWGSVDAAPGVESSEAVLSRVLPVLQELWTSSSSAVIVTHDAIIRPVIDHLDRGRQLSVPTASWCVMVAGTSGWEVVDVDQVAPGREP